MAKKKTKKAVSLNKKTIPQIRIPYILKSQALFFTNVYWGLKKSYNKQWKDEYLEDFFGPSDSIKGHFKITMDNIRKLGD